MWCEEPRDTMTSTTRPAPLGLRDQARRCFWRLAGHRRRHGVPAWLSRLEITRHDIRLPGLPADCQGLTVAQLSDFHIGPLYGPEAVAWLVSRCNTERPDLVLLTGDFLQKADEAEARAAIAELGRLRSPLGLYGSLGNHDHWEDTVLIRELVAEAGITLLTNAVHELRPGLWLAGLDDLMGGEPDMDGVLGALPDGAAVILMSHSPGILQRMGDEAWLVLSGHTHGIQFVLPGLTPNQFVALPGVKPLLYAWEWFESHAHQAPRESISTYRYPAGWYHRGESCMYVSRGVGFFQTMPLRFNCPAELPLFTLSG